MKKIQCLKDFNEIEKEYPNVLLEYLKDEFDSLYEYLSIKETLEDFKLPDYQEMIILESTEEMVNLVKCSWDLEFKDKIILQNNLTIWRIGMFREHDVQLYYFKE